MSESTTATSKSAVQHASGAAAASVPAEQHKITAEVASFVAGVTYADLPPELVELGKMHILDALGLAVAGQRAETGPVVQRYLGELGVLSGSSSVFGTNLQAPPRFAAFA